MIRVEMADALAARAAGQAVEAVAGRLEEQARQLRAAPSSGQTLHQDIAGFVAYLLQCGHGEDAVEIAASPGHRGFLLVPKQEFGNEKKEKHIRPQS